MPVSACLKAINSVALPHANAAALFHEDADKDEHGDKRDTCYEPLPRARVKHGIPPGPLYSGEYIAGHELIATVPTTLPEPSLPCVTPSTVLRTKNAQMVRHVY